MITRIIRRLIEVMAVAGIGALLLLAGAAAAGTFTSDRFSMQAPDGWSLTPQTDANVYIFKGSGNEVIIVEFVPKESSPDKLMKKAVAVFEASGVSKVKRDGKENAAEVNGRPALWGYWTGVFTQNNVKLHAALGSIALKSGGLYFVSILNDASRASLGSAIEAAFRSIK